MKRISIILALALMACHHHADHYPVHAYRQQDASGDWIWYYLMFSSMNSNSCPCYYYSSPTQVTNFQSASFERVETPPPEVGAAQPIGEMQVPADEVPAQAAEAFNENTDANDGWGEHSTEGASEVFDESPAASDAGGSDGSSSGGDGGSSGGGE